MTSQYNPGVIDWIGAVYEHDIHFQNMLKLNVFLRCEGSSLQ